MTIAFKFGKGSLANLVGVDPKLVQVTRQALILSTVDFTVVEGCRTVARQEALYAQGRTKPGNIVTWTMHSNHIPSGTPPYGKAVDLVPINPNTGAIDWGFTEGFNEISRAMFAAADTLRMKLRWGADWDGDGVPRERGETDSPHFELDE